MMDLTKHQEILSALEMYLYPFHDFYFFFSDLLEVFFCLHYVMVARNID